MKNIEAITYTYDEVQKKAAGLARAAHAMLEREEKRLGAHYFETFGEWKKQNPTHPNAKKKYPDYEYVMVISEYKEYFDSIYPDDYVCEIDIDE